MVALLMLGLLVGGGGVGAAWALSDDSGSAPVTESGPAGDARAACQALDGFDEAKYGAKGADGDIALNRYAAAGVLSASAAAGDAKFKPLAQAIRRSQDRHAQVFDFDEMVKKDLDEARRICKGL
ncbi:hypothetical protein OG883_38535 [Streptomyces sp. NBC_01142]|uniref:hypothetical protein n=1 Tax=Streptomyces sp. NBC_01142 TaxID=2975865 RepID=UPI00224EE302|nr:hypothetical protein [Streptomyces sp. NBC_01142]MCX4825647.1 hypothetical protein [Streptomyces sp. NBC_01142]